MGHDEVDLPYSPLPGAEGDLKVEDSTVERLKWKIPKDLASDMVKVAETWKKERQNLQSSHVDFEDFGKNEIKVSDSKKLLQKKAAPKVGCRYFIHVCETLQHSTSGNTPTIQMSH